MTETPVRSIHAIGGFGDEMPHKLLIVYEIY